MKKSTLILILFLGGSVFAQPVIRQKQKVFSWGTTMTTDSSVVEEKIINWTTTFEYKILNKLIATAKEKAFTMVTVIEIKDANNKLIGSIEREIFKNFFSIENTFSIKNTKNQVIYTSRKLDFLSTDIEIFDMSNNKVAGLHRDAINLFGDGWTIKTYRSIDQRLIIFIPAFKTHSDDNKKE